MDNNNDNNTDRLSSNTSLNFVDDSMTVGGSAGGQNGNIEVSEEELVVSTLEDENDGDFSEGDLSLREAIALSNEQEGADTITFNEDLNGGAIALDSSLGRDLTISDSVFVASLGRDNLTLNGSFIFDVEADTDLTLDGLNLVGGKIDSSGNLTFSNSSISQH